MPDGALIAPRPDASPCGAQRPSDGTARHRVAAPVDLVASLPQLVAALSIAGAVTWAFNAVHLVYAQSYSTLTGQYAGLANVSRRDCQLLLNLEIEN